METPMAIFPEKNAFCMSESIEFFVVVFFFNFSTKKKKKKKKKTMLWVLNGNDRWETSCEYQQYDFCGE